MENGVLRVKSKDWFLKMNDSFSISCHDKKRRVLIIDDIQPVRNPLRALVNRQKDMEVVGEAKNGIEAVAKTFVLRPHLIVMDIEMPNMNGIVATRLIHHNYPDVKIVALSMYPENAIRHRTIEAGASGFIPKEKALELLIDDP